MEDTNDLNGAFSGKCSIENEMVWEVVDSPGAQVFEGISRKSSKATEAGRAGKGVKCLLRGEDEAVRESTILNLVGEVVPLREEVRAGGVQVTEWLGRFCGRTGHRRILGAVRPGLAVEKQ